MTLALDPRLHRVWRTPGTLQFGVERPVLTLTGLSNAEERMLVALDAGVTLSGLELVAERAGGDRGAAERFLGRLGPVLAREVPAVRSPLVVLDGDGPAAVRLVQVLRECGADVRSGLAWNDPAVREADAAVIVGSFALAPERHRRWLRRDVPHLPVVFGDETVTIGPFVEPGAGPCVGCVELHRCDAEPDWPAMAGQLHTRDARRETSLVSTEVAAVAARAVLDRTMRGSARLADLSMSLDYAAGFTTERAHRPHEECGCRSLPGSGTADVAAPGRPGFRSPTS